MKILIVCYYGLVDSIECAANALRVLGHEVDYYPLFKYVHDRNDKLQNYADHFAREVQEKQPHVMIWWYINIPPVVIEKIASVVRSYVIFFNWDDPWSWEEKEMELEKKCKYFDLIIATCKETLPLYLEHGAKAAIYSPPGYDPKLNYPLEDIKYNCDISFCCTNLYDDQKYNKQYIPRKKILDAIADTPEITFHLYGPIFLQNYYPKNYKGYAQYNSLNDIFNKSRINLCTHVIYTKDGYINERTVLILGSGGLLLVDHVEGMKEILGDASHVVIKKQGFIAQIKEILANYKQYEHIKTTGYNVSKNYTWYSWAQLIHDRLSNVQPHTQCDITPRSAAIISTFNLPKDRWLQLYYSLSSLKNSANTVDALKMLSELCQEFPDLDINYALNLYSNM